MIEVSTSILDLSEDDFAHSIYNLESSKTDYFHIDVMDGEFVIQKNLLKIILY